MSSANEQRAGRVRHSIERLMLGSVALAPLGWGGMHPVWAAGFAGMWILLAAAAVAADRSVVRRLEPLPLFLIGLAVLTLLRGSLALPFAASALELEVFAAWDLQPQSTVAGAHAPRIAWQLLGLAGLAIAAQATRRRGSAPVRMWALVGASLGAMIVGVVHGVLGADRLFGVFAPRQVDGLRNAFAAPYVNENQAGALWAVATLGLASMALDPTKSMPTRAASGLFALGGLVAIEWVFRAHGVVVALVAALALLTLLSSRPRAARPSRVVVGTATLAVGVAGVGWGAPALHPKASYWAAAFELTLQRPWLGWGAGAFPDIYWLQHADALVARATYVESGPLQIAFDYGWPLAVAGAGCWLVPVARSGRALGHQARMLALAIFAFVSVESTVGMGAYGVGLLPLAIVARSVAIGGAEKRRAATRGAYRQRVVTATLAVAAVTAVGAATALHGSVPLELLGGAPSTRHSEVVALPCDSDALSAWVSASGERRPADARAIAAYGAAALRCGRSDATAAIHLVSDRLPDWWVAAELRIAQAGIQGSREAECAALAQVPELPFELERWREHWLRFAPTVVEGEACAATSRLMQREALRAWVVGGSPESSLLLALGLTQRHGTWLGAAEVAGTALLALGDASAVRYAEAAWDEHAGLASMRLLSAAYVLAGAETDRLTFTARAAEQLGGCAPAVEVLAAVHAATPVAEVDRYARVANARCGDGHGATLRVARAYARALERAGNALAAMAAWRRCVALDADDLAAWDALTRLAEATGQDEAAARYARERHAAARRAELRTALPTTP